MEKIRPVAGDYTTKISMETRFSHNPPSELYSSPKFQSKKGVFVIITTIFRQLRHLSAVVCRRILGSGISLPGLPPECTPSRWVFPTCAAVPHGPHPTSPGCDAEPDEGSSGRPLSGASSTAASSASAPATATTVFSRKTPDVLAGTL